MTEKGLLRFDREKKSYILDYQNAKGESKTVNTWPSHISPSAKKKLQDDQAVDSIEVKFILHSGNPKNIGLPDENWVNVKSTPNPQPFGGHKNNFGKRPTPHHHPTNDHHPSGDRHRHNNDMTGLYCREEMPPTDDFVYPYNFIRIGDGSSVKRGEPAGHDRYDQDCYTGCLTIRLIPESPWFIPEPEPYEGTKDAKDREGHCKYHFLRDADGKPKLPATSIKGMVRSTFEALTESCFSVFSFGADSFFNTRYNPKRFKHAHTAQDFKPGRVFKRPDGNWGIMKCDEVPYWIVDPDYTVIPNPEEGSEIKFDPITMPPDTKPWRAKRGEKNSSGLKKGYLKPGWRLKSTTPGKHHFDRAFIETGEELNPPPLKKDWQAFRRLLERQATLPKAHFEGDCIVPKSEKPQKARGLDFLEQHLKQGVPWEEALVYYRERPTHFRNDGNDHVYEIGRVAIPSVSQRYSVLDLLPDSYHPCHDAEKLCPACRVFGMVAKQGEGAYRGNVRFGESQWHGAPKWSRHAELKVLGTPHPESTNFYLIDKNHANRDETSYDDSDTILRGRKRYWVRQQAKPQDYTLPVPHPYQGRNQNMHADLLMPQPDAYFTVEMRFENLQGWELGALLFALELPWEKGHGYHQIGHGKPLGLGKCRVKISQSTIWRMDNRYRSLGDSGTYHVKEDFTEKYKQQMEMLFKAKEHSFETLPPIADLKALTTPKDWAIRYPEFQANDEKQMGEKTFAWFNGPSPALRNGYFKTMPDQRKQRENEEKILNVEFFPDTEHIRNRRDIPLPLPEEAGTRTWHGDKD